MINLPKINLKNQNTLIIFFLLFIILYICSNVSSNVLIGTIMIIIFLKYYKTVYKDINKDLFMKKENDLNYNNKIENLLSELENYKKISPYKYNKGIEQWKSFINELSLLEDDKLYNYSQHFENALLYLKESTNTFMSFGVESKERKYVDGMEYGDFENTKELNRISKISRELYDEGYKILYNLSLRLNNKWLKNPNIHNKEIVLNYPQPNDKTRKNYDYF
jgi:hypothetical protein